MTAPPLSPDPWWRHHLPLTLAALISAALLLACLVGLAVDHRAITGAPAWAKPAKFSVSIALYCLTLVWMLGHVRGRWRRPARVSATIVAVGLLVELAFIVAQVLRGTTSHFNVSTPLNAAVYFTMGGVIVIVWAMSAVVAVLLSLQRFADPVLAFAARAGLGVSLLGAAAGALMTVDVPHLQGMRRTLPGVLGSHTVGAPDGGAGLPFLGWSAAHGDLRVPHFFGLHALQALPLLGALVGLLGRHFGWSARRQIALLGVATGAYLGWFLLLIWQALRGESVTHPGALTMAGAGVVLLGGALGVVMALRGTFRSGRPQ